MECPRMEWVKTLRENKQKIKAHQIRKKEHSRDVEDDKKVTCTVGATIRDLCAEDRRRIADLIRELAEANAAREATEKQIQSERAKHAEQLRMIECQRLELLAERDAAHQEALRAQQLLLNWQEGALSRLEPLSSSSTTRQSLRPLTERLDRALAMEEECESVPSPKNKFVQVNSLPAAEIVTDSLRRDLESQYAAQHRELLEHEKDLLRRERAHLESVLAAQQVEQVAKSEQKMEAEIEQNLETQTPPLLRLASDSPDSRLVTPKPVVDVSIKESEHVTDVESVTVSRSASESLLDLVDLLESSAFSDYNTKSQMTDDECEEDDSELLDGIFFVR